VLGPGIKRIVHELDPLLVTHRLQAQTEVVRRAFWRERLQGRVVAAFAALAVALALCGVYGVLSYTISQRTAELGIRLAVGASRGQVLGLVIRDAIRIGAIGAGAGLLIAIGAGRALSGILYEVSGTDPRILAGAGAALLIVAVAASIIPALRASRLDPVKAIRIG
jgi:ABC-type antimicrobial peptide transport system permease subunit